MVHRGDIVSAAGAGPAQQRALEFILANASEALNKARCPLTLHVIEGPLMDGKYLLPQAINSERCMKKAAKYLLPFMEEEKTEELLNNNDAQQQGSEQKLVLLATVKGDVHNIGKNFVGVVLGCNNFKVVDLGVMCDCNVIMEPAS